MVLYEELTKPWVPGGSFRRGVILETEGLGTANSAAPLPSDEEVDDDADLEAASDGLRCASCAPDRLTVAGERCWLVRVSTASRSASASCT